MATLRSRTPRLPRVPEKAEQRHIVQLTRSIGGEVWELGTTRPGGDFRGTCQTPGMSDLVLFVPRLPHGRELVFVEVKGQGGRLRPEQEQFRAACLAAGATHLVGGLDTYIEFLVGRGLVKASAFPHYRQPKERS